jgi:cysteine-rich repeat protein
VTIGFDLAPGASHSAIVHCKLVRSLLAVVVTLCACTDDAPADGEGGGDESETGPPIFEPPEPECGNGYLESGEQCDDANLVDGDGCDSLCQIPCGMLWETTIPSPSLDVLPTVVDVAVGPNDEIVVAGLTDAQTSEVDNDIWLGAWSGAGEPLWSGSYDLIEGLDDAPAAVAVAPDGAVYLSATLQAAAGTDIWVGRFDQTGSQVWSATFDAPILESNDVASGMAVTPSGNPLVAGKMRVADGDTDLWIAELSADAGAELWSTTWSGPLAANGYSLDVGGPVAVGSDGTIWATVVEYVAFDTFDVHVLSFDPTGVLLGDWAPQVTPGVPHDHVPDEIAVQADGSVFFSISRIGAGATFWIHRLDPSDGGAMGEIAWVREMPSFVDLGEDWVAHGVAAAEDGNVFVGGFLLRDEVEDDWNEGWMHRLDPAGEPLCTNRHMGTGATIVPPNLLVYAIGATHAGELVAAGRHSDVENANSFWVGSFRGP